MFLEPAVFQPADKADQHPNYLVGVKDSVLGVQRLRAVGCRELYQSESIGRVERASLCLLRIG